MQIAKIQKMTLMHEPQPLKRRSITAPSPLKIHPNNPPATKKGECTKKYIVVKQDGSSQINRYSSVRVYYRFLLYVPRNEYSELSKFEKEVKTVLDEQLYPLIKPSGQTETDFYDDNINGHLRVFLYQNNVRDKYV